MLILQIEHTVSERDVLRQMNFPFVVHLMSSFQDENFVYFVLEYSSGGEFFRHLKLRGRYATFCQQAAWLSSACKSDSADLSHANAVQYKCLQ